MRPRIGLLLVVLSLAGCGLPGPASPDAPTAGTTVPTPATPELPTPLVATSSPTPVPTPAPTGMPGPVPSGTPIPAGRPAARFGYVAKGMTAEVMAFVGADHLAYASDHLDFGVVSTLAFFSLVPTATGDLPMSSPGWRAWTSPVMDAVIARAHAAGTRVVLSLARFAWSAADVAASTSILASPAVRHHLADVVAAEVVRRGVDGVNVDFEPIPVGQAADFTDFVRRLRRDLDDEGPGYQLTVAVTGHYDSWDVAGLVARGGADALYLMGYEYAGSWSTVAFSTAPYGGPRYNVATTVQWLLRVVRPDQLIVGVPYYGHLWPTAGPAIHARTLGGGGDLPYPEALRLAQANGIRYDPVEQSAWSEWEVRDCSACALHWVQLYFDDAPSLAAKWAFIRDEHLLGTGVWRIEDEGTPGAIDAAMRAAFLPGTS